MSVYRNTGRRETEKIIDLLSEDTFWTYIHKKLLEFFISYCLHETLDVMNFLGDIKRKSLLKDNLFKLCQEGTYSTKEFLVHCSIIFANYGMYCGDILDEIDTDELTHFARIAIIFDKYSNGGYITLLKLYTHTQNYVDYFRVSLDYKNMIVELANIIIDQLTMSQKRFHDYVLTKEFRSEFEKNVKTDQTMRVEFYKYLTIKNMLINLLDEICDFDLVDDEYTFTETVAYVIGYYEHEYTEYEFGVRLSDILIPLYENFMSAKWHVKELTHHHSIIRDRIEKYNLINYKYEDNGIKKPNDFVSGTIIDFDRTFTAYFAYAKNNHQFLFSLDIQEDDYIKYHHLCIEIASLIFESWRSISSKLSNVPLDFNPYEEITVMLDDNKNSNHKK